MLHPCPLGEAEQVVQAKSAHYKADVAALVARAEAHHVE